MRLNKDMQETIVKGLATKVTKEKYDEFSAQYFKLVKELADASLGKHQENLRTNIPADILDTCFEKGLHVSVQHKTEAGTKYLYPFTMHYRNKRRDVQNLYESHNARNQIPEFVSDLHSRHNSTLTTADFPKIHDAMERLVTEFADFRSTSNDLLREIEAVVYSCNTYNKLIEVLPAAEPFIQKPSPKATQLIPLASVNKITDALLAKK
mgnify:CR=1 FL=1